MKDILHGLIRHLEMAQFLSSTITRLLLAVFLGGLIGLEREFSRKPAGLRTNTFICFGAAMYTVLSVRLGGGDAVRIAAQIIPGIGFIGAGSILHAKNSVSGLTTAATLFVVASIGMATGGGLYLIAIFATMVILVALRLLGGFELRFNLKPRLIHYEVAGEQAEELTTEINEILEDLDLMMESVQVNKGRELYRVKFAVEGTRVQQAALIERFHGSALLKDVRATRAPERE